MNRLQFNYFLGSKHVFNGIFLIVFHSAHTTSTRTYLNTQTQGTSYNVEERKTKQHSESTSATTLKYHIHGGVHTSERLRSQVTQIRKDEMPVLTDKGIIS